MSGYQPSSRRPIADVFRLTAQRATAWCVAAGVHPDTISYASIVAAAAAALCFWQSDGFPVLLLVAPAFCYARLWCNMLDGMVALAGGKASKRGEIVNELPDRVSDILIFAGVARSGWCVPDLAYWSAMLALMTAYVGTLGQAVGVQREYSGVMAKPWRMVALHMGAWLTWFTRERFEYSWTPLDYCLAVVIAGCVQTVAVRLSRVLRALDQAKAGAS
ncbi:MAG: CDP-alcohol phosphatidyltransferase family protein [Elusimicrobia bacterium]|nr:CDP-alcohol phosphatidyltransferase family protein [Elusimicrobiota bacterium]